MRHLFSVSSSLPALMAGLLLTACGGPEGPAAEELGEGTGEQAAALTSPSASISCARTSGIDISCTANASGGSAPYDPQWQNRRLMMGRIYVEGYDSGGYTRVVDCLTPEPGGTTFSLTIRFRVFDANGAVSNEAQAGPFECAF
ncbi:hypothetical protein [Pyxidicoccus xibeiensis]|uniref:hypothetical protein n=1 Tax=Pyxidicoccus xibeiensis TaxID=2906759 RepID=UPI0020A7D8F0|nr:hypothetical protein [Pyxidicoccus xibeiensis]MCP3136800.1 hypothetical protein [Pyxidicoccus xibeiensis]